MSDPSPTLPLVTAGMIWDGVTEYQNVRPWRILLGFVVCTGDGTRRFSDSKLPGNCQCL